MRSILKNKKGTTNATNKVVGVVVAGLMIAFLGSVALTQLFNSSNFTGVPSWVVTTLGLLGVVAFITILLNVSKGSK